MTDFRETLYTVDHTGKRRWVYAQAIKGRFYKYRALLAAILIVFYLSLPWILISGKQAVLLDIANRKFVFFGTTFWASDSYFLVVILGALGIALFFFTSLLGRVWCGWACPETVFLEFIFRPLEVLIEGNATKRERLDAAPWGLSKALKKGLKYTLYALISWLMASTFLAYFIGRETLLDMMSHSPKENLVPFVLTLSIMAALLFQFGWFREQFCTIVCPYARFQSVLMDPNSLLVGYDKSRGEPRTKASKTTNESGDCVDCKLCVRVCPTGIDIRNGTQLECVHCAQCVDACDSVMGKLGRPLGLVRYDSERNLLKLPGSRFRLRSLIYGVLLCGYALTFYYLLATHQDVEVAVLRSAQGAPFEKLANGKISNHFNLHLANKSDEPREFKVYLESPAGLELTVPINPLTVAPGKDIFIPAFISFDKESFGAGGRRTTLCVKSGESFVSKSELTLLGPES